MVAGPGGRSRSGEGWLDFADVLKVGQQDFLMDRMGGKRE